MVKITESEFLKDSEGFKSSKRLAGISCIITAHVMGYITLYFALNGKLKEAESAMDIIQLFLIAGVASLGSTAMEWIGKNKKKKESEVEDV